MKPESTETPQTAIVIFTRYFDRVVDNKTIKGNILNHLSELGENTLKKEEDYLKEFFTNTIWEKLSPDTKVFESRNSIKSTQAFWKRIKLLYQDDGFRRIAESFLGKICRYAESNVYLYHHWLDKQLSHTDPTIVKEYVQSVLGQIWILRKKPNFKWYVFLHEGDFVRGTESPRKLSEADFKELMIDPAILLELNKDYFIERFSHDSGNPIFDFVINDDKLHSEISSSKINDNFNIEEFILNKVLQSEIDKRFYELIDN